MKTDLAQNSCACNFAFSKTLKFAEQTMKVRATCDMACYNEQTKMWEYPILFCYVQENDFPLHYHALFHARNELSQDDFECLAEGFFCENLLIFELE